MAKDKVYARIQPFDVAFPQIEAPSFGTGPGYRICECGHEFYRHHPKSDECLGDIKSSCDCLKFLSVENEKWSYRNGKFSHGFNTKGK